MKKLFLILIMCLILCSCGNNNEQTNDIMKNIKVEDLGIIKSDFGEECLLLKATSNNPEPISIFSKVLLKDDSNKDIADETGVVNLYNGQTTYYVVEISSGTKYKKYELENEAELNFYKDYKNIYNNVSVNKIESDEKEVIKFKIENKSKVEVYTKVLGLFYKDNKIIAASVGICDNVKPNGTCEDSVYIPIKSEDDFTIIDYDKAELLLMEVNYDDKKE